MNTLYFGDNLDVLHKHVMDESVDLVYLDPPFNSKRDYNVIFKEATGALPASQMHAFEDSWHWNDEAARAFDELATGAHSSIAELIQSFQKVLGKRNDVTAYLVMMAPRLIELHRVLNPTGSLYLHCDSTVSHYLKMLLDAVFGPTRFRNEIVWQRTHSHGNVYRNFGSICDILLFYSKSDDGYVWSQQHAPFDPEYIEKTFKYRDPDGRRWQSVTLRNPGKRPNLHYPYKASNGVTYDPHRNGWSCDIKRMTKYDNEGRLHFPSKPDGALRLKMYLDESPGIKLQNLWSDINVIGSQAGERLGYPTQKPEALLERIILTSSNEGDVVLDPILRVRDGSGGGAAAEAAVDRDRCHLPRHQPHRVPTEGAQPRQGQ